MAHIKRTRFSLIAVALSAGLLMANAGFSSAPSTASSQQKVVFTSDRTGNNDVYTMNIDGTGLVNLTNNPANDTYPSWSPDGSKIVFNSDRSGNPDLFTMNVDGTAVTNITNSPDPEFGMLWSPDGSKIFSGTQNGQVTTNFILNADGSNKFIVGTPGNNINGIWWSPDSSKFLIYTFSQSSISQISVLNADGTNETQLTSGANNHLFATWSPDGSKIAYFTWATNGSSPVSLWVMNSDGTGQTYLADVAATAELGSGGLPLWSPDSSKILYSYLNSNTSSDIYYISPSGGSPVNLTNGSTQNGGGWVNNNKIIFNTNRDGNEEIYTLDINSLVSINITNNPALDNIYLYANGFITSSTISPPPPLTSTPTPPKTGKLIGATIATISLISIILLLAKEVKAKHHTWGGER